MVEGNKDKEGWLGLSDKMTPEEKILAAIFGEVSEEIKGRDEKWIEEQRRREEEFRTSPRYKLLKEQVEEVLRSPTDLERRVLKLSFGLDDGLARTYDEIGQQIGRSPEVVERIEQRALEKLRHPSRVPKLEDFPK